MRKTRALFLRLAGLFHGAHGERDMVEEIESNLQLQIDGNIRSGMSPADARRAAILKFGNIESAKDSYRDRSTIPLLETFMQDMRYAARTLRQNPGFATVAGLTLGLGIGASTTMFGVVQAILLRPLPFAQPARLVEITETNPLKHWTNTVAAPANFADWRKMNAVFTDIAAYLGSDLFLSGSGEPQRIKGLRVTGNLFDLLGIDPLLGRAFTYEETFAGRERIAILSYDLWQATFASDPHVIGRKISLTGSTYEIVGVMPRGFFFPNHEVHIFVPLGVKPMVFVEQRRPHGLNTIARLRPGVTLDQATSQMSSIARRLEQMYPDTNTKMGVRLDAYRDTLTREKRPALLMLLAAVTPLFLIVCSNVANLQLGRAAARSHEIGIRQALGAARGRLVRQLLTESLLLSLLGGALGLVLAAAARAALLRFAPNAIPSFAELRIDSWVIFFNVAITICAPLLFGIVPALSSSRSENLRDRSDTGSRGSGSTRNLLVACEVALSVVLVAGAGLLIRSLIRLESVEPGFNPEHAIGFRILLPEVRYSADEQCIRTFQNIENRIRSVPGVQAVGASLTPALGGVAWTGDATPEGRLAGDYERELRHDVATPDYFRAMGTPLLRGRFFNQFDTPKSRPVTVVNETLEKAYFPDGNALGKRIKFGRPKDAEKDSPWVTVVGVIADQKQDSLDARVQPEAFSPLTQMAQNGIGFVLRGTGNPNAFIAAARHEVHSIDPDLVLTDVISLRDIVSESVGHQRFRTSLLSSFAAMGLFLAALGVYGVLAYSVTKRSKEIGIRLALGASKRNLFAMVLRDGMRPVVIGAVLGLAGAFGITGLIKSMLFGVAPVDPPTFALTVAILCGIALCGCLIPAAKAIGMDPLVALRGE